MAKYQTIEELEAAARSILKVARDDERSWCPTRAAILNVFHAYPMSARTADHIMRIARAVEGINVPLERVQDELTKLVRQKHLRSRTDRAMRLYEVAI